MEKSLDIAGVGIDIVEIETIVNARFKKRLAEYFLTKEEGERVPKGPKEAEYLASRFAAKEAVIKAFPKRLKPQDFTIEKKGVRPVVSFSSEKYASQYAVQLSLSHTKHIAAAVAIVTRRGV